MNQIGKYRCGWPVYFYGLLSCIGVTIFSLQSRITDAIFDSVLVLTPTSPFGVEWTYPSGTIKIEVFMFNWTNPQDFKNNSVKPRFTEMGPYTYYNIVHRNIVAYNENSTISYYNNKTYHFSPEESSGSTEDLVTNINVIPLIASDKARNWNFLYRNGLALALGDIPYNSTRRVKELIFDGYEDELLNAAKYLPFLDDLPSMDKFAWFYQRNGSAEYEGLMNVGTGQGNKTIGTIYSWNNEARGPYPGKCARIQESIGEFFPQHITKDKLRLFTPDFCKIITLEYEDTVVWNGIEGYRFVAGVSFLDNGTYDSDNKCLCKKKCPRFGVIDYSSCKFGIPAYLSLPHFNKADPYYRNAIDGMKPDESEHKISFIINPRTGVVLNMTMAVQLNMQIEPNPKIGKYSDVPEIMFPMFWFRILVELPTLSVIKLWILLQTQMIINVLSVFILASGIILLIFHFKRNKNKQYEGNIIYKNSYKEASQLLNPDNISVKKSEKQNVTYEISVDKF